MDREDDQPRAALGLLDTRAALYALGQGLLAEDVLPGSQGFYDRLLVEARRSVDSYDLHTRVREKLLRVRVPPLGPGFPLNVLHPGLVEIRHRCDRHLVHLPYGLEVEHGGHLAAADDPQPEHFNPLMPRVLY